MKKHHKILIKKYVNNAIFLDKYSLIQTAVDAFVEDMFYKLGGTKGSFLRKAVLPVKMLTKKEAIKTLGGTEIFKWLLKTGHELSYSLYVKNKNIEIFLTEITNSNGKKLYKIYFEGMDLGDPGF